MRAKDRKHTRRSEGGGVVVGGGFEGMVVVDEVKRENTVGEKGIRASEKYYGEARCANGRKRAV